MKFNLYVFELVDGHGGVTIFDFQTHDISWPVLNSLVQRI